MDNTSRLLLQSGEKIQLYKSNNIEYCIKNPSLCEILSLESKSVGLYFKYLYSLVSTSLDVADILFCEAGIWYEDIKSEWEFFLQKILPETQKTLKVLIKTKNENNTFEFIYDFIVVDEHTRDALNFFFDTTGEYILWSDGEEGEHSNNIQIVNVQICDKRNDVDLYLYDENNFRLTAHTYNIMIEYLKKINWIKPQYDFLMGGNKYAKGYILKQDYKKRKRDSKKESTIDLSSIVSSIVAKGQKYNDILNYSIYLIYDLYYRLVKIDEWENTMQSLSNGCIDTKKNPINWEKINWSSVI